MTQEYTLALALYDLVPNLAFLAGAVFLVRAAQLARGLRCAWWVGGGALLVWCGGMFQATWKLLYTIGVGDLRFLSEAQFALLAPGFVLMLFGTIALARGEPVRRAAALVLAAWQIPLLIVTTLCSVGAYGLLTYTAWRHGARLAAMLFIAAVICLFAMSGMASGEQTVARQWIEQSINAVGQSAFAVGSFLLYRTWRRARVKTM